MHYVVVFYANITDFSYAHFPASCLSLHSTNLALVFMCLGDYSAL